eukprot:1712984-Rhodomonas_salina.1
MLEGMHAVMGQLLVHLLVGIRDRDKAASKEGEDAMQVDDNKDAQVEFCLFVWEGGYFGGRGGEIKGTSNGQDIFRVGCVVAFRVWCGVAGAG